MNKLLVYLNKEKIGVLSGDSRNPKFSYTISVFNTPLSLSMKDTTKSYGKSFVHFIENLRIEDKEKLKLISAKSKLSPENYYQYFKTFGLDCAGSIQFVDEQEVEKIYSESTNIIEVNDKEIEKKVLDNVNNINIEDEKQHCSLAGYQPKILLLKKEGRWYTSNGTIPTTHIIKPGIQGKTLNSLNEYICLKIYKNLNISTSEVEYKYFNNTPCIVVERYDRELKDGKIKRIHQEDICQSLNVPEENKYLVPSTDIVKLLINNSGKNSQYNIETFFKALLLSNLIGSEDGHAKNYSLMLQNYNIKLAPIYDVFSVYDNTYDLNKTYKTAMKIGDCNIIGKLKIIDIRTFAKKNKLIFDNLLSITKEICERLPNIIEKVFYENSNIKELLEFKDVMIYNVNLNCNNLLNDIKNNS